MKIVKTRIVISILFFLSVWMTYQYMESIFAQPYTEKRSSFDDAEGDKKITVTVFYECLCPDSKRFIIDHLLPSYEKAPHLIKLQLIPYGKAETKSVRDSYEFTCQHGSAECHGNKVHACVINKVDDEMTTLKLISCLLEASGNVDSYGPGCAKKFDVPWTPIIECARSKEGSSLLKEHGDSTAALSPEISFVPTILLNQNRAGQPAILKNLWREICRVLPETTSECH